MIGYIDETGEHEVGGTLVQSEQGKDGREFKAGDEKLGNLSREGSSLRDKARWRRERSVSIGGLLVSSLWPAYAAQKRRRRFLRAECFEREPRRRDGKSKRASSLITEKTITEKTITEERLLKNDY